MITFIHIERDVLNRITFSESQMNKVTRIQNSKKKVGYRIICIYSFVRNACLVEEHYNDKN